MTNGCGLLDELMEFKKIIIIICLVYTLPTTSSAFHRLSQSTHAFYSDTNQSYNTAKKVSVMTGKDFCSSSNNNNNNKLDLNTNERERG